MNLYKREEEQGAVPSNPCPLTPAQGISGWYIAIPLVAFVILAAVIVIGGGWLGAIRPTSDRLIYQAEGNGNADCPGSFTVDDDWELRWEHSGGEIQEICWKDSLDVSTCYVALHRKPIREHGSVNIADGGTYTLHVTGEGDWKLSVYRLNP